VEGIISHIHIQIPALQISRLVVREQPVRTHPPAEVRVESPGAENVQPRLRIPRLAREAHLLGGLGGDVDELAVGHVVVAAAHGGRQAGPLEGDLRSCRAQMVEHQELRLVEFLFLRRQFPDVELAGQALALVEVVAGIFLEMRLPVRGLRLDPPLAVGIVVVTVQEVVRHVTDLPSRGPSPSSKKPASTALV